MLGSNCLIKKTNVFLRGAFAHMPGTIGVRPVNLFPTLKA